MDWTYICVYMHINRGYPKGVTWEHSVWASSHKQTHLCSQGHTSGMNSLCILMNFKRDIGSTALNHWSNFYLFIKLDLLLIKYSWHMMLSFYRRHLSKKRCCHLSSIFRNSWKTKWIYGLGPFSTSLWDNANFCNMQEPKVKGLRFNPLTP